MNRSITELSRICVNVIGILVVFWFLTRDRGAVNDAVMVAGSMVIASICTTSYAIKTKYEMELTKTVIAVSGILSVLLILQLSLSEFHKAPCFENKPLLFLVCCAAIWANVFSCIVILFHKAVFTSRQKMGTYASKLGTCKIAIAGESLLFILSTYPAIWIQADTAGIYESVLANSWSDWHTIGYLWFVKLCTCIYESLYSVVVIQTVFWIFLNFYILDMLEKLCKKAVVIYTLLMCIAVTPFIYLEGVVKDTVFSMGVLALTAVAFKVIHTLEINRKDIICLSVMPLFTLLCRHGGVVPVFCLSIFVIIFLLRKERKKIAFTIAKIFTGHLLIYLLINIVLMNAFHVQENPSYVKYGIPMAMIGAAASEGIDFDNEDQELLEQVMPMEKWAQCYDKYCVDNISRPWGTIGEDIYTVQELVDHHGFGKDLLRMNAKLLLGHPVNYLTAFLDMNSMVWEIAKPNDVPLMTISEVPEDENISYSMAYSVTNYIALIMDRFPLTRAATTRGGLALFVLFFCGAVMAVLKKETLICMIPILLISGMLVISITGQDPRYILPTVECAIFMLSIVLSGVLQKKQTQISQQ